jgi:hypothetical protein
MQTSNIFHENPLEGRSFDCITHIIFHVFGVWSNKSLNFKIIFPPFLPITTTSTGNIIISFKKEDYLCLQFKKTIVFVQIFE